MSITKEEKKKLCKEDYFNGVPIADIISSRKVSKSTFYSWVRKNNWIEERKNKDDNYLNAPEKLEARIRNLVERMENTNDPAVVAKYADSFSKLTSTLGKLYKKDDRRSWIIFTITELFMFLKNTEIKFDDDFKDKLDRFLESFQDNMLKKYPINKY